MKNNSRFSSSRSNSKIKLWRINNRKLKGDEVEKYNGEITGDEFPVTVIMDGYELGVNGQGNIVRKGEQISKIESYVGYYADMDADGTVDGIIYADLAIGGSGIRGSNENGTYEIPKKEIKDLKEYYISQTNYSGTFGEKSSNITDI